MSVDDCESAAMPVWRKRSNRVTGELLVASLAGEHEQTIAPRRRKYNWSPHRSILFLL
jgi:hypothetical protein